MKTSKKNIAVSLILCLSLVLSSCSFPKKDDSPGTKGNTAEETPSPNHENAESNLGHWGRALASVQMYMNEGSVYYFGGYEANDYNMQSAQTVLEQSWNIKTRKALLKQVKKMLNGQQRKEYLAVAKEVNSYTAKEFNNILEQLPETSALYYSLVQYNWEKWQKKGMLAWDLCRMALLVQWGYLAGYISLDEAQALIEPAAKKLQKKFTSWEDVQMNFLDGFAWWAQIDLSEEDNDYEKRKSVYEEIVANQETEGLLYDDSMFTEEIVPIADVSYKTILSEVKVKKSKVATGGALTASKAAVSGKKEKKNTT